METFNIILLIIMYLCTSITVGLALKTLGSSTTLKVIAFIFGPIGFIILIFYFIGKIMKYIFE